MNKSLRTYLFALIALIVVVFLIDSGRKKPLNWAATYSVSDKIPLGLYVLDHEIDSYFSDSVKRFSQTPYEYFQNREFSPETYLIIDNYAYTDAESYKRLIDNVGRGSTLFVSSDGFQTEFLDTLGIDIDYKYLRTKPFEKDTVRATLTNGQWQGAEYALSPIFGQYRFSQLDTATTTVLGFMHFPDGRRYVSFVKVKFGQGTVYLHNQPSVFSNYGMLSKENVQEYAARSLSYIPNEQPVVWFVRGSETDARTPRAQTVLGVIFRYPALRAAWLVFLYGLALFIFFQAKRRQRVVPVINPPANTTVEFTQTIGNLYYQEGDTANIVQKKIVYFLDKVRNRYYLDTRQLDDAFIQKLHAKSGKNEKLIANIVHFIQWFERNNTARETDLVRLNEFLEEFWEKD